MTYHAPVKQIRFALDAIANLPRLYGNSAFGELGHDLVDAVLDEAGRFAGEVIAPLNRVSDKEGAKLENGVVTLPTGFVAAYKAFVAGGWNGITGPTEFGGQGLPHVVGIAVQEMWQSACMAFGLCPVLTQGVIEALQIHGTPEQQAVAQIWCETLGLEAVDGLDQADARDLGMAEGRAGDQVGVDRVGGGTGDRLDRDHALLHRLGYGDDHAPVLE